MSTLEFDGQPMTKREILIARVAWDEGYDYGIGDRGTRPPGWRARSSERYPLPKVTRPRVVNDPHGLGRWGAKPVSFGTLAIHYVASNNEWETAFNSFLATTERVALWADLLANPTEEVEDDS